MMMMLQLCWTQHVLQEGNGNGNGTVVQMNGNVVQENGNGTD